MEDYENISQMLYWLSERMEDIMCQNLYPWKGSSDMD